MAKKRKIAWESRIQRKGKDGNGDPHPSLGNLQLVFKNDSRWREVLGFDEFIGDIVSTKLPPWGSDYRPLDHKAGDWSDNDMRRASVWAERQYQIRAPLNLVKDALFVVADTNKKHPVRDYLTEEIRWDRTHRADRMFIELCGAKNDAYSREISKNFLIGAVARIMRPGCQLDSMPILEGKQGVGKTTFFKALFGDEWFMSSNIDITSKDGYQVLQRKWCCEMGELESLSRRQVSAVKQFVSQPIDTYRPSYGHKAQDFPRQCVFAGTTNDFAYLKDGTGARRFWPLVVTGVKLGNGTYGVDLKKTREWRDQLFAEAYVRFKKGEAWHITDPELLKAHSVIAEEKREVDPWETAVTRWVDLKSKSKGGRRLIADGLSTYDVLTRALRLERGKLTKTDEMRAAETLRTLGFSERSRVSTTGGREWKFRKPGSIRIVDSFQDEEVSQVRPRKKGVVLPVLPRV